MKKHGNDSISPSRRNFLKTGPGATAGLIVSLNGLASAKQETVRGDGSRSLQPPSPAWTKDLIIYEIAPKGFTSPNGPESGTFNSLKAKLPYLQELGITGIWLAGYSVAQPHYFYNIWSQYSHLEPDKIDPSLGTPKEFKSLIDDAHNRGIRIFLDVIVHGVHSNSPLIKTHPDWFGKWVYNSSVADYDWFGGHTDLDDWWVKIWTEYATQYGVDGYRLDIDIARPDLWERIRQNAAAAGHPIVLFEEGDSVIPGVTDFSQHENFLSDPQTGELHQVLTHDVPGFYDRKFGKAGDYRVEIRFADYGSREEGSVSGKGTLRVRLDGLTTDQIGRRHVGDHLDGISDIRLTVDNVSAKPIDNIIVTDDMGGEWQLRRGSERLLVFEGKPPSLQIYLATLGHGLPSIQLSCHDNGWDGFPLDKNPYAAQGSRALFGYSFLFTPMIPVLFSGEEFNASFRPIPWLAPHYLGSEGAGKGRWLYGCMLDWDELNQPEHRGMFEDVKSMMAIRKQEADVLAAVPYQERPRLIPVACERDITVPIPYLRWNDRSAILVAANRNTSQDAHLKLRIPLREADMAGRPSYKVTELRPGGRTTTCTENELAAYSCTVKRDKTQGGGLCVLKIEPNS